MPQATEVIDHTDTTGFDADQAWIWAEQKAIYAAFLAGDRARIDRWIHPTATIWDGVREKIAHGLEELDAIRATRPVGEDAAITTLLAVEDPSIAVLGEVAVQSHVLRIERENPRGTELIRVSAVWHRIDGSWWIVHSHEDIYAVS